MTPRRWLAGGGLVVLAVLSWALAGTPIPGRSASPPAGADAGEGKALYQANCASCHGVRGEGQPEWKTKKPDGLYPAPPQDASGHTWHHADGLLFSIVREGGQVAGPSGFKSGMPAFGGTLSDAQVRATLEYIKTLWGPAERKSQSELSLRDPYP